MIRKILFKTSLILFNVSAILFGFTTLFDNVSRNGEVQDVLDSFLGAGKQYTINTGKPPVYYKSWYQGIDDLMAGNGNYAAAAEAEGAVLLKNENDALPLNKETDKISLFGVNAYQPVYSLLGAGKVQIDEDKKQTFGPELEKEGFTLNKELSSWYESHTEYYREYKDTNFINFSINGASWDEITTDSKLNDEYNTAIYVLGRVGNEGVDLPPYTTDKGGTSGLTNGDYLKLTSKEISVLEELKKAKDNHIFDKIIVLVNSANPIQEPDFLDKEEFGIDAALWVGLPGSNGIPGICNLLSGDSTPSGRLSDTWYTHREANPTYKNFGNFNNGNSYVLYQEGMYIGYKYSETRYEDYVLNNQNAGTYNYDENVNYPFGYGLSYTTFEQKLVSVVADPDPVKNYYSGGVMASNSKTYHGNRGEKRPDDELRATGDKLGDNDDLIVNVEVTNTGEKAGKEVVQVYLQQPYTEENKTNQVEKPAVELVGFAKTSKLEPGTSETVQVKIDANKLFASYDITQNDYILDEGKYYLTVANNAHDAVNNILAKRGISPADHPNMDDEGDESLVKDIDISKERSESYKYWTLGEEDVTNLFDHADPNKVDPNGNKINFMSRSNWTGTVSSTHQRVDKTDAREEGRSFDDGKNYDNWEENYPYYEKEDPTFGRELDEPLMLIDMKGIEYDPSRGATDEDIQKWSDFLDQLTWDEMVKLTGSGRRLTEAIDSIAKPLTNDLNASNGLNWRFNPTIDSKGNNGTIGLGAAFDPNNRNRYPTGYPCEGIIASTFNIDLAHIIGQAIGEDALWAGASGLYGFGLNLHRNPYHGRAGEYYSEDPFLTGVIAGYESLGAQEKGLYVYNKHFVLNDQEVNRSSYASWITEQALRQEHLRPFEIALEISDAMCVMTGFNRIGTYWTGNDYNLMTRWLRGEAGMAGFAVTDWYKSSGMNMTNGHLAGNDLPDGDATSTFKDKGPGTGNEYFTQATRISAMRILYTVANSNAMNFIGEDTIIYTIDPAWWQGRDILVTTMEAVFIALSCCLVGTSAWMITAEILNRKRQNK